jgi:hypothetical protein
MDTFNIKIHRATDSFLYLPAYIAKDLEIFQTILGSKRKIGDREYRINIVFEEPKQDEGDEEAISKMIDDNTDTSVAIAICSPVAFLKPDMESKIRENVRVVGAIINKLTFWAVDHEHNEYSDTKDLKGKFTKVIYPSEKFITGCYLGREVQRDAGITDKNLVPVEFDTEIEKLRTLNCSEEHPAVAVTADIATLAEATTGDDPELYINHHFSRKGDFLTTGIVTSKKSCDKFPDIIAKIIEAIQKSIAILYSSEITARRICAGIASRQFANKFTQTIGEDSDAIREIIRLMNEEEFYPADLNISEEGWDKAVKALSLTRHLDKADDKKIKSILSDSFYQFVDNKFVRDSEKSIAEQFGINLYTFRKIDITKHIIKRPFKWVLTLFERNLRWSLSILVALIVFALIFVCQKYSMERITLKDMLLNSVISPVSGIIITYLFVKKNE